MYFCLCLWKEDCKSLRRAIRFALYQQRRELLVTIMNIGEEDTKTFYIQVMRQRARPSTARGILRYDGDVLVDAEEITPCLASHFRDLATSTPNNAFDDKYYQQIQCDTLV